MLNASSLPLEPFSSNAEISQGSFLFRVDEKEKDSTNIDLTNILDVERSKYESEHKESVIVEKWDRFETKPRSRKECPWYKKLPGDYFESLIISFYIIVS